MFDKRFFRPPEHLIGNPAAFTPQERADFDAFIERMFDTLQGHAPALPLAALGPPADAPLDPEWLLWLLHEVYPVEGARLILERRGGWGYVQYAVDGGDLMAETMSNVYRDQAHRLSGADEVLLRAIGWEPPLAKEDAAAGGVWSPNFFRSFRLPAPVGDAAALG